MSALHEAAAEVEATGAIEPAPVSWAPEVVADSSGRFVGNGLRFGTYCEALAWAEGLSRRWALVTDYRAVPSHDPVNR